MTTSLRTRLEPGGFVVLDGALASELERRGHDLVDPLWSARALLEAPQAVLAVHLDYIDAGADIITTATYQATLERLRERGYGEKEVASVFRTANALARQARDQRDADVLVAASIGPYGAFLADGSEYVGRYGRSVAALVDFHAPRLELVTEDVDLVAFETIPDHAEVRAIAELLARDQGPPALVSFSIATQTSLRDGTPLEDAVMALRGIERVAALGVNCCDPSIVSGAIDTMRRAGQDVVMAYPNGGGAYSPTEHAWEDEAIAVAPLLRSAREWVSRGAKIVGGCCRTGPEFTRGLVALREELRRA